MAYEVEIQNIRAKYGSLEHIRNELNFSRREICEFLLVDPSAWSRWVRGDQEQAPAHVYRTLGLLMEKQKNNPQSLISWQKQNVATLQSVDWQEELTAIEQEIKKEIHHDVFSRMEQLKKQVVQTAELTMGWKLLLILNIVLVIFALF